MELAGYVIGDEFAAAPGRVTYAATRSADGREVLIKTLSARHPALEDSAALRREYHLMKKLADVEGVIHVEDLVEYGSGNVALVMEPSGGSIAERLQRTGHRPMPLDDVITVAIDVSTVLGALHESGVVHKSVVPRSIVDGGRSGYCLTDLSIASELVNERQAPTLSPRLQGSLPYISPEQTGRMNRDVDYRSDLYSLGVTCFEMLTGMLPFAADHAGEWVYSHICKTPPPPGDLNPEVPAILSAIVLKLLAKNAEDRYQSAYGLTQDLERCRTQLRSTGIVVDFPLGEHDVSRRFQLSQQLFGRERELSQLLGVFELVAAGSVELCLVAGDTGVGKTALVSEIGQALVRVQSRLLQGKFDQFQSNAAYSAVGSAFGGLVAQLLTEPPEQVEGWRRAIIEALGSNGQLMLEVIPELVDIIGPQPTVPDLPPTEARNRFHFVFDRFVRIFATAGHPLVIFLDDLQWSDAPTLELIKLLVTSREMSHLLVIGAFRSGEVDAGHPLHLALSEIRAEHDVELVSLLPLDRTATKAMVAETLHCDMEAAADLADLLHDTSQGNPFFINEMLRTLHKDGMIAFSPEAGTWAWDVEAVRHAMVSDDVAAFMAASLRRLPGQTLDALVMAACIGSSFDLRTLSVIAERSVDDLADALVAALERTLVVPLDGEYRLVGRATAAADGESGNGRRINPAYAFHHDRVQQAAYECIDDDAKQVVHLRIGRLMQEDADEQTLEKRLIDVVGHLNRGRALIVEAAERRTLSALNLRAGNRAKRSSAYQSALEYVEIGTELLTDDAWSTDYDLALGLTSEHQQCAYLLNRSDEADQGIEILLRQVRTDLERAEVLAVRTRQYATLGRMEDSIRAAIAGLALLDIRFPDTPTRVDIEREKAAVVGNLGDRSVEDLLHASQLTEPHALVAIRLLTEIFPAAFLSGSGDLFPFLVLKLVNLSLTHGTCPETAFAYATYGMLLCGALDDPATGYRYGKLAVAMNEMLDDIALQSRVVYVYAMFILHWSEHWSSMTPWFRKGIESGYQTGDLLYLAYSAQDCIIWDPRLDLETASKHHREYLAIVADCHFQDSLDSGTLFLQLQLNLLGETDGPTSLSNAEFDEDSRLKGMLARRFMTGVANYHIYKSEVCLLHGYLADALAHVAAQDQLVDSVMSLPQLVRFRMVAFLALAQAYPSMEEPEQQRTRQRLDAELAQMRHWAANCPDNFEHLALTMEAERWRLSGSLEDAIEHYDRSVEAAHASGFLRDEAVAYELAGRCLLEAGRSTAAEGYLRAALRVFGRWGARRKVALLEAEFSDLLGLERARHPYTGSGDVGAPVEFDAAAMDVDAVIRASQAISGELSVDRLWATTFPLVLENAGGQRGCVLARRDDALVVETQSVCEGLDEDQPPFSTTRGEGATLPMSVIESVLRTGQPVVLNDVSQPSRFSRDAYLATSAPQSLLCLSMAHGDFEGVIYLEHRDATGVFTENRIEFIRLLASQAMISLENAELYQSQLRLTEAQSRFVPRQFLESLEQHDIAHVELGEHVVKEMSVLFADVRGFTTLSEYLHPREVIVLLNQYFEFLEPAIREAGGFIDSFAGDGIMALFEGGPDGAVDAGIGMCRALERFNDERRQRDQHELQVGIGVDTGPLVLGTVGAYGRLQCTVIGDTVNAASRIEQLTKTYGARLLVGQGCVERLTCRDQLSLRELDRVAVKGKTRAFDIYEVLDAEVASRRMEKEATKGLLAEMLAAYRSGDFAKALELAKLGTNQSTDDGIFALYATRCETFIALPPQPPWAGVEDF